MVNATVRSTLSERYEGRINYPFTAIVGQEKMKLALLLNAINPQIGGVLIRGERGSGKTIAVRALSDILPEIEVAAGCRFSCDPSDISKMCVLCREKYEKAGKLPVQKRKMRVVELPIGTTEDRVVGTLNIERAIKEGVKALEIGMLAEANRGILYLDNINLLDDHIMDVLLDSAAMGVNVVEREGVSVSHPASFILIGTMNPEEGELRPQLHDRLAFHVEVKGLRNLHTRLKIVKQAARVTARMCIELDVDGHRPDIIITRAALAKAAYEGRLEVNEEDLRFASELTLGFRMRRTPFEEAALSADKFQQVLDHAKKTEEEEKHKKKSHKGTHAGARRKKVAQRKDTEKPASKKGSSVSYE
ncbi:MAG: ATP-binding protein [Proteobacteria bacterium]|nr:ATP-binding protein [Pseudomonadota bacterium]